MNNVRKTPKTLLAAGILACFSSFNVWSALVIDPDNTGANRVWMSNDNSSSTFIGYSGRNGALELNANGSQTNLTRKNIFMGDRNDTANGIFRIIGNGTSGSAQANISEGIYSTGGSDQLEIKQGGVAEASTFWTSWVGSEPQRPSNSTTIIDGQGSVLRTSYDTNSSLFYIEQSSGGQTNFTVSGGGLAEAQGRDLNQYESGGVLIGSDSVDGHFQSNSVTNVNITGAGSTIRAQHHISVSDTYGQVNVDVNNGGQLEQQEQGYVFNGIPGSGIYIGSFVGANVRVSDTNSAITAASDIAIGTGIRTLGFTADGKARRAIRSDLVVGEQATDVNGSLLFYPDGRPVINVTSPFGYVAPETALDENAIWVNTTGHLLIENEATVTTAGDIHISSNNANAGLAPVSGQDSTLTVRDFGTVNAQNIFVNQYGRLQGGDGLIDANVIVNGGTVAPGNSPGQMFINGDLKINSGKLELEYASANLKDILTVGGEVTFGANAMVDILFDFVPTFDIKLEDFFTHNIINVNPGFSLANNINLKFSNASGVKNGDVFTVSLFSESYQFRYNSVAQVPVPATLALFSLGLVMLRVRASKQQR